VPASSATTGSYSWTVADNTTTQAMMRVSPTGQPGNGDTSDVPFMVALQRIVP